MTRASAAGPAASGAKPADPDGLRNRNFERVLLIKLSAVGDVVHTLPVLAKLRSRYPAARIDWLITPECADLVRCHPALSGVVLFPRRRFGRSWSATRGMATALARVRRARYDLVVDMHGQIRTATFALASGAPVRAGFENAREGARLAYSHRIPVPSMDHHAVDRYLWLGDLLGFDKAAPDFSIHLPPNAAHDAAATLSHADLVGRPLALLLPGTAWETKHWRVEGFAAVARHLLDRGFGVAIAGAGRDRPRCAAVAAACPGAVDICGRTSLATLAALMRRAAICVTNDSGPMHLAVALGVPVVSAFGPTSPLRTGPYRRPEAVVRVEVPCSPCYIRTLRRCPYEHRCMTSLATAMMIDRLEAVLSASSAG